MIPDSRQMYIKLTLRRKPPLSYADWEGGGEFGCRGEKSFEFGIVRSQ